MTKVLNADVTEKTGSNDPAVQTKGAISRRTWLAGAAMAGVGAVCLSATRAEAKMKPELAKYQDTPKGEAKCSGCSHFQEPDACKVVDGKISPEGWCQLFAKKS